MNCCGIRQGDQTVNGQQNGQRVDGSKGISRVGLDGTSTDVTGFSLFSLDSSFDCQSNGGERGPGALPGTQVVISSGEQSTFGTRLYEQVPRPLSPGTFRTFHTFESHSTSSPSSPPSLPASVHLPTLFCPSPPPSHSSTKTSRNLRPTCTSTFQAIISK